MDRRVFLGLLAASALPAWTETRGAAQIAHRTRAILLGTAGGPTPKRGRAAPAAVVLVDGVAYVVDCGNGVARQMVLAGVELNRIRHVFITHHHSDHNADFGTLLLLAWAAGLSTAVDTWGPPPLTQMTDLFLQMSATDIDIRIKDEGRPPLAPLIHAHDVREAGVVVKDERVTVRCAVVHHPMVAVALAYRIDGPDRSLVFSGDTTRADSLIALARGARRPGPRSAVSRGVQRAGGRQRALDRKAHPREPHPGGGGRENRAGSGRQDARALPLRARQQRRCGAVVAAARSPAFQGRGDSRPRPAGNLMHRTVASMD